MKGLILDRACFYIGIFFQFFFFWSKDRGVQSDLISQASACHSTLFTVQVPFPTVQHMTSGHQHLRPNSALSLSPHQPTRRLSKWHITGAEFIKSFFMELLRSGIDWTFQHQMININNFPCRVLFFVFSLHCMRGNGRWEAVDYLCSSAREQTHRNAQRKSDVIAQEMNANRVKINATFTALSGCALHVFLWIRLKNWLPKSDIRHCQNWYANSGQKKQLTAGVKGRLTNSHHQHQLKLFSILSLKSFRWHNDMNFMNK